MDLFWSCVYSISKSRNTVWVDWQRCGFFFLCDWIGWEFQWTLLSLHDNREWWDSLDLRWKGDTQWTPPPCLCYHHFIVFSLRDQTSRSYSAGDGRKDSSCMLDLFWHISALSFTTIHFLLPVLTLTFRDRLTVLHFIKTSSLPDGSVIARGGLVISNY